MTQQAQEARILAEELRVLAKQARCKAEKRARQATEPLPLPPSATKYVAYLRRKRSVEYASRQDPEYKAALSAFRSADRKARKLEQQ